MIKGTAKPTALTMNCALALQVSERMPPTIYLTFAGLFVALVAMTTYWLWKAPDLEAKQGNPNVFVRQLTIDRGLIYAADRAGTGLHIIRLTGAAGEVGAK